MAHRRGMIVGRQARRATEWIGSADTTAWTNLAAGASIIDQALTGAQVSAISPFTVIRTVGLISVRSDQEVASEDVFGALGAMVVRETARAGGVGNVPTPITEESDDGFFLFQFVATSASPVEGHRAASFQFDSKAQRKVEDGDAIVWTVENSSAAAAMAYVLLFRMLIKVH